MNCPEHYRRKLPCFQITLQSVNPNDASEVEIVLRTRTPALPLFECLRFLL